MCNKVTWQRVHAIAVAFVLFSTSPALADEYHQASTWWAIQDFRVGITLKGLTNDGTTDLVTGRDSTNATVFSVDTDGTVTYATGLSPRLIGGTGTTSTLTLQSTSGVGTTGADIIFKVGNNGATEAARILNSGAVGIGTATPAVALDIVGAIAATTTGTIGTSLTTPILIGGTTTTSTLTLQPTSGAGTTNADIVFKVGNNGATEVARILNSGNVGIGTAAPTNILSLGNGAARKFWIESTATDVVGRALTVAAGGTVAGTSVADRDGGNLILTSGLGTGTGVSSIVFQTGKTLATGLTLQTMTTALTILGSGTSQFGSTTPAHVASGQTTPPSLTSCGTNPPTPTGSTDTAGLVTMGTDTPTGCIITFNVAYTTAPFCTVTWIATPLASQSYSVSNAAITLVQTATSSNKVAYTCIAPSGG